MQRDLRRNEQVWERSQRPPNATVWIVDGPEPDGIRCWRHDGKGGRIEHVFRAEELETLDERNQRGREEEEARKPKPPRKPLYDV
jgi:hypothetical protein